MKTEQQTPMTPRQRVAKALCDALDVTIYGRGKGHRAYRDTETLEILGLDSLDIVELTMETEKRLGMEDTDAMVEWEAATFHYDMTLDEITDLITEKVYGSAKR